MHERNLLHKYLNKLSNWTLKDALRFKPYNPERVWWTAYFTRIPGSPFGNTWASNAPQP